MMLRCFVEYFIHYYENIDIAKSMMFVTIIIIYIIKCES